MADGKLKYSANGHLVFNPVNGHLADECGVLDCCQCVVGFNRPRMKMTFSWTEDPWQASTTYRFSTIISATDSNGTYLFILTGPTSTAGGVSGGTEPSWDLTVGNTTTDNGCTWTRIADTRQRKYMGCLWDNGESKEVCANLYDFTGPYFTVKFQGATVGQEVRFRNRLTFNAGKYHRGYNKMTVNRQDQGTLLPAVGNFWGQQTIHYFKKAWDSYTYTATNTTSTTVSNAYPCSRGSGTTLTPKRGCAPTVNTTTTTTTTTYQACIPFPPSTCNTYTNTNVNVNVNNNCNCVPTIIPERCESVGGYSKSNINMNNGTPDIDFTAFGACVCDFLLNTVTQAFPSCNFGQNTDVAGVTMKWEKIASANAVCTQNTAIAWPSTAP
jgi:hypothetical protein